MRNVGEWVPQEFPISLQATIFGFRLYLANLFLDPVWCILISMSRQTSSMVGLSVETTLFFSLTTQQI